MKSTLRDQEFAKNALNKIKFMALVSMVKPEDRARVLDVMRALSSGQKESKRKIL